MSDPVALPTGRVGPALRTGLLALLALAGGCCPDSPADLDADDPQVRRQALACQAEDPADPQALAHAAAAHLSPREPDPAVRATAARVLLYLHQTGAHRGTPEGEGAQATRQAAQGAPPDDREPDEEGRIAPRGDPHWLVRVQAVATLRGLLGSAAAPTLREALSDPERDVRMAAARELGLSGDDSAATTQALIVALSDQAPEVRYHARRALRALLATDEGLLPEAWENWERQRQERLRSSGHGEEEPSAPDDETPDRPDDAPAPPPADGPPDQDQDTPR